MLERISALFPTFASVARAGSPSFRFTRATCPSYDNMKIKTVQYTGSWPREHQCPKDGRPEYAFIGRSNVGKSSLINMLMERKDLAHTSGKPGKTQMLNYYVVNDEFYLVDLPGYGYARAKKTTRAKWKEIIDTFMANRKALVCAFVLIDANVPPQDIDIQFVNRLGELRTPFVLVFTKTDKLKPLQLEANVKAFQDAMLEHWNEVPQHFITSASKRIGRDEVLGFIEEVQEKL